MSGKPIGHHFADLGHAFADFRALAAKRCLASTWDRLAQPWFQLAFGESALEHAANAEFQRSRSCTISMDHRMSLFPSKELNLHAHRD